MNRDTVKKNSYTFTKELPSGKIETTTYTFNCLPAKEAGKIGAALTGKVLNGLSGAAAGYTAGNCDFSLDKIFDEDTVDKLYQLIFNVEAQLHADGKFIIDPDIFFQGRLMEMYQLIGYALRCNCEDFFTTIGGWFKKNKNFSEMLKSLKEKGLELPQEVLSLLQNSSVNETEV